MRRTDVPVHQNQICATEEQARSVVRGDLRICHCDTCDFVWNAAFDVERLSYHDAYDNTQTCSPVFGEYIGGLVSLMVDGRGVRASRIVEVGCGKGEFLRRLVAADAGNAGTGFDPSYVGELEKLDGRLRYERSFFGREQATGEADVVVSRHVIEHIDDPLEMLALMRAAIAAAPEPRLFLETPDVTWILRRRVVWDFFYEHCSYFSPRSIEFAGHRAGLRIESVDPVFGEQYMWIQGRPAEASSPPANAVLRAAVEGFERAELELWERLAGQIEELSSPGAVAVWGAGAKGVTFVNQLDPRRELIDCVVDVNPAKQGRFLPGTGHPIVAPAALEERGVSGAILLNPNYEQEIRGMLAAAGSSAELAVAEQVDARA